MNSLIKYVLLFLSMIVVFISYSQIAFAENEYVDECLENPENCEEESGTETEQETNETESELLEGDSSSGSLIFELVKLFFALLFVLALIYVFLYFLKRRNKLGSRLKALENIGGISVGQNKSIQLIRLADRLYIIGVGEDITLLQEIKDDTLIEEIMKEKEEQVGDLTGGSLLTSILKKKDKSQDENKDNFKNLYQQELKNLQQNRKNIINRHKEDNNE